MTSIFAKVEASAPDPIFSLSFLAKKAPEPKADLIIGAYRDADGRPYPLRVVRKAEQRLLDMNIDKEYLPMRGFTPFIEASVKLAYGDAAPMERIAAAQGISGTGSLSIGMCFLARCFSTSTPVYVSSPTWPNHYAIVKAAGFQDIRHYRYYDASTRSLDFAGLLEDLTNAPEGSIVILHACAHNPTGVDATQKQWKDIAEVVRSRRHVPFFDSAYQGYATGSLENDAYAIRLFAKLGLELVLAQSYSKNMGLYCERAGVVSVLAADPKSVAAINGNFESIVRMYYSSPPAHGARVAHMILTDPLLRKEWEEELRGMSMRVQEMRQALYDGLTQRGTPGTWSHVVTQVGMFSYLGLTKAQCEKLMEKRVFLLSSGRANMAGITKASVNLIVDAIDEVVRNVKEPNQGIGSNAKL